MGLAGMLLNHQDQRVLDALRFKPAVAPDEQLGCNGVLTHAVILLFGLSELEQTALEVVACVNTRRVCAKELVMFHGQTGPKHRHPPFEGTPGKDETFRCRRAWCTSISRARPRSSLAAGRQRQAGARTRYGTRSSFDRVGNTSSRRTPWDFGPHNPKAPLAMR